MDSGSMSFPWVAMTVKVTDEYYPEYDERERFVSGEHSYGPVYDDDMLLTIGGMPEFPLTWDRVEDLRDVLTAALELRNK